MIELETRDAMSKAIEVRALDDDETVAALQLPKFDNLKPVRCSRCDHRGDFARRIFSISGVSKSKFSDDAIQETISSYITATFGISYSFFKSPGSGNKLYVDSAICPVCQSTRVVFDIQLTDDFWRETAKALGHPGESGTLVLKHFNRIEIFSYTGTMPRQPHLEPFTM
jgi:hypothetical protein